ncbi:MAG: aminopeptidase P family protein, partial [Clostridia bacterium]|nr:aminopeptidase P family protein [Clostridia bacterium]
MENGRKLFAKISEKGYDGAVFTDEISQRWLTGFPSTDGFVLVSGGETLLVTDGRYIEAAKAGVAADTRAVLYGTSIAETIRTYAKNYGWKKICIDGTRMTVAQLERLRGMLEGIEIENLPGACAELRRIKTPREIEAIRTAQSITDAAFTHILTVLNDRMTETQVAAELEYFMRRNGADGTAFETIAVSGKKSSLPHGVPGDVQLTKNAFLTMDYGARYQGYCSDMTRTVVIGKADEEMRHVYETVREAQAAAERALKPGA